MGNLFGTDGVRGIANQELTPELAFKLGRAGAYILSRTNGRPRIVIGKDTRISGDMLEAALTAGICSIGGDVLQVGVIPTPGIAYLTRTLGASAGVVISASHNPFGDNGIKFFSGDGFKLSDEIETEIEKLVLQGEADLPRPTGAQMGKVEIVNDALDRYVSYLFSTVEGDLTGLKIAVDCANGAASAAAPRLLRELGAEVYPLFHQPNGTNINNHCGSTHPEALQQAVVRLGVDVGIAHDGDADRVLAVDEQGRLIDGDVIMAICALELKKQNKLAENTVVTTVMSNLGFRKAMEQAGIIVKETKVGDRYVMEEMLSSGAKFGGEQSGHIIFLDHNTTGDGLLTAVQLLSIMKKSGRPLSELAKVMTVYPQLLVNVPVNDKAKLGEASAVQEAIAKAEARLAGKGRLLVRPSGTEPLIRVMAEGPDEEELRQIVDEVAEVIAANL